MSDKRPTREEAMEVAKAAWSSQISGSVALLGSGPQAAFDAVSALFGGYAPSPVEVPVVGEWSSGSGVRIAPKANVVMSASLAQAVAARSNAWEEIKEHLKEVASFWANRLANYSESVHHQRLEAALDLMSRPEMGIGPKNPK